MTSILFLPRNWVFLVEDDIEASVGDSPRAKDIPR